MAPISDMNLPLEQQRDALLADSVPLKQQLSAEVDELKSLVVGMREALTKRKIKKAECRIAPLKKRATAYDLRVSEFIRRISASEVANGQPDLNTRVLFGITCYQVSTHNNSVQQLLREVNDEIALKRGRADDRISSAINFIVVLVAVLSLYIAYLSLREARSTTPILENLKSSTQSTAETLRTSATDFRGSADAAKRTQLLLENSTKDFSESAKSSEAQYRLLKAESQGRQLSAFKLVNEQLHDNKLISQDNLAMVKQELELLKEGKQLVAPLTLLKTGAWQFIQIYPAALSPDLVTMSRQLTQEEEQANELIRSRENFRVGNLALLGFSQRMALYDQQLEENFSILLSHIQAILKELGQYSVRHNRLTSLRAR